MVEDSQRIQRLLDFPLIDAGNAESFLEIHGDRFIFVPKKKKWFMGEGIRWPGEEYEARPPMLDTVRIRIGIRSRLSVRVEDEH